MVEKFARELQRQGRTVAILSRGYRSRGQGIRVVSAGEGPLLGPLVAGDEPVLLAGELPGVAVVVSPDRYAGGRHALERLDPAPDVFILDDGFSHLKLFRRRPGARRLAGICHRWRGATDDDFPVPPRGNSPACHGTRILTD